MKAERAYPTHHVQRLTLLAILLLAAFLRFHRLNAQSFWNDEGNSARIAERTPALILEGAEGDIHPPGYYLLLHYWRAAFGQSEFALRSLSVVAGLALVLCTYLLGSRLLSESAGLMAAFLGALSPLAVYYSQEARMYALLGALSVASTYLLLCLLMDVKGQTGDSKHPASRSSLLGHLVLYVVTSAAGLYTQYAFPFVLFVHNGIFGLWWLSGARASARRFHWLGWWAGTQVAVTFLYLPWLPTALQSVIGWSSAGRTYELIPALLDTFRVLCVGITLPLEQATVVLVLSALLLSLGLWPHRTDYDGKRNPSRTARFGVACLALYLLLPVALILVLDLYKPTWLKFLVVVLAPLHILIAYGIENLARIARHALRSTVHVSRLSFHATRYTLHALRTVSIALLTILVFPSLRNLYYNPTYARDDYRQIATDIAAVAKTGNGVVLNAPNQWEVFTYYYPDQDVYPAPYRPKPDEVEPFLNPLLAQHRQLFVLYWGDAESDPQRLLETYLATHAYKASDRWYGRVRLATYGLARLPEEPTDVLDARFGTSIYLRGYGLTEAGFVAGDILPVTLFWEAEAPIAERYKVTVQLLDDAGQLVTQHDSEPGDGLIPTTLWEPGVSVFDRYGLPLPHDLAPGRYALIVGLYHITLGERLLVTRDGEPSGDRLPLETVQITRQH